jgi:hypothetical protein
MNPHFQIAAHTQKEAGAYIQGGRGPSEQMMEEKGLERPAYPPSTLKKWNELTKKTTPATKITGAMHA